MYELFPLTSWTTLLSADINPTRVVHLSTPALGRDLLMAYHSGGRFYNLSCIQSIEFL